MSSPRPCRIFLRPAGYVRNGILTMAGLLSFAEVAAGAQSVESAGSQVADTNATAGGEEQDPLALHYHLMHPGGESAPGDPNAAFYLDGTYHLHYILRHPWQGKVSFSFVHVTSPDMLHWEWQPTKLQPAFTGHGMFSGTGFVTKEGRPAVIYHGQGSGRNQIAVAKDRNLSAWEKPYPVEVRNADGTETDMQHWDPDCFLIGDTYYGISGGQNPPVFKSKDLKNWIYIGDFMPRDMPDVALGEDISCPNFFPLGDRWMLLCISHPLGCRYYLGDWNAEKEQFESEIHGRMNWRREGQDIDRPEYRDFFAPESVLTPDGRRVMWAWLTTLEEELGQKSIQSLPRELSLAGDGGLRIRPLRELETLRQEPISFKDITVSPPPRMNGGTAMERICSLEGDAHEILVILDRSQAERKRFGFRLFADEDNEGLLVLFRPETGTLRLGHSEAPFAVSDLPPGEDVELRIFIDKYLVEVFVNSRQAMVAAHMDYLGANGFEAYTFGAPTTIRQVDIWRMKSTNQGYQKARQHRIWLPETTPASASRPSANKK
jgi:beta-fructofuranosidase